MVKVLGEAVWWKFGTEKKGKSMIKDYYNGSSNGEEGFR